MKIATDTNALVYALNQYDPNHAVALRAMTSLLASDDLLCIFPQCLYEFWSVVTRPDKQGVSLLAPAAAHAEMRRYKTVFEFLPDVGTVFDEWEKLVLTYQVIGPKSFDTRIVAAMQVHGVKHVLTFNTKDFTRYPNITIIDPATV